MARYCRTFTACLAKRCQKYNIWSYRGDERGEKNMKLWLWRDVRNILPRHNKPEFAYGLIAWSISTRCFYLPVGDKRKSASCCGFMFFMKSTTFSGTGIFFVSLFFTKANIVSPLWLAASVRFGFRWLCSVIPFLPRPIVVIHYYYNPSIGFWWRNKRFKR